MTVSAIPSRYSSVRFVSYQALAGMADHEMLSAVQAARAANRPRLTRALRGGQGNGPMPKTTAPSAATTTRTGR